MHLTWSPAASATSSSPARCPQTLVGLRQSLGIAWLALIVAETVSAHSGLGYMINHAREFLQTDVIVVGLAVYSLLGLAHRRPRPLPRRKGAGMALLKSSPATGPVADPSDRPWSPGSAATTARSATPTCCESIDLDIRPGEFVALLGPQRLRQVHAAAQPGRPRPGARRRGRRSTAARRSPSRSRGCCPGAGCATTSRWRC